MIKLREDDSGGKGVKLNGRLIFLIFDLDRGFSLSGHDKLRLLWY